MSTSELKSNLHQLIDKIQDSKTINLIYNFVFKLFEKKSVDSNDSVLTHFSAESSLAKDWNMPEEDKAWQNL